MTSAKRPILWDIYEEHLDEAAFLWGQWERAMVAANYVLDEVIAGPEERLLAHLDGLVLGGQRVADNLLIPALADEDAGKVFGAAWTLLQAEDADHLDLVVGQLPKAEPPAFAALARALELCTRQDLVKRMGGLWDTGDSRTRGALLDILAPRDPAWAGARLERCLATLDFVMQSAALRALRVTKDRTLGGYVGEALASPDGAVRQEAIATGHVMQMSAALDLCRREASTAGESCRLPLALLALGGLPADRALVVSRMAVPDARKYALWALGFFGDVETVERLLDLLDDEGSARIAGESLSAITGIAIDGPMAKAGVTKGPGVEDVQPDDPVPDALPEDLLRTPAAAAVRKWWDNARTNFEPGARYLFGKAISPGTLGAGLRDVRMWRRGPLYVQRAALNTLGPPINLRTWARAQRLR
jgi:uncharacterized protein (TIGR02270 family)